MAHRTNGHTYKKPNETQGAQHLSTPTEHEGGPIPLDEENAMDETLTQTVEDVNQVAENATDAAKDRFRALQDEFKTFSSKARQNAEQSWNKTRQLVEENPASAVGIALLVGAGLGALLTAWAKED